MLDHCKRRPSTQGEPRALGCGLPFRSTGVTLDARIVSGETVLNFMVERIDIERALEDLISNEEGMRFQGLAVALAQQRWPELIACERHNDLGLDAYGVPTVRPMGLVGLGLLHHLHIWKNWRRREDRERTLRSVYPAGVCHTTKSDKRRRKEMGRQGS